MTAISALVNRLVKGACFPIAGVVLVADTDEFRKAIFTNRVLVAII
jgi:hypothetical protein